MPKRKKEEAGAGAPAWMTTYGDMVTLLLTFFIMLYAFSSVDTKKYIQVVNSLRGALGGNVGVLNDGTSVNPNGEMTNNLAKLRNVYQQLQKVVKEKGMNGQVELSINERGITISFKEKMFFKIGSADLLVDSYPILDEVAAILREQSYPIRVEGHTCDLPIKNYKYPSNWELSAIRAVNVARFMIDRDKVAADRISTAAYSQYRPIVPNTSDESRARNRRVDIIVINNNAMAGTKEKKI